VCRWVRFLLGGACSKSSPPVRMFSVEDVEDNGGVDALPLSERARFRTVADVGRGKFRFDGQIE